MKNKSIILAIISFTFFFISCQKDEVYVNPVLSYPISNLTIQIGQTDYIATPILDTEKGLLDSLVIKVKAPNSYGTIKALDFADKSFSSNIGVGDVINFIDDVAEIDIIKNGNSTKYYIDMQFTIPPHMFLSRSGSRGGEGNVRYYVDEATANRLVSFDYNDVYTGFLDLTNSSWDNIGFVADDFKTYYDYSGGGSGESYYSWPTTKKVLESVSQHFPCDGPWNNWTYNNGNVDIVSPGFWFATFNTSTLFAEAFMTQWAISGTATSRIPMSYNSTEKEWEINASLSVGSFRFVTIPVSFGDPELNYGANAEDFSQIGPNGDNIQIDTPGQYSIRLSFENAPYYTYSLTKL